MIICGIEWFHLWNTQFYRNFCSDLLRAVVLLYCLIVNHDWWCCSCFGELYWRWLHIPPCHFFNLSPVLCQSIWINKITVFTQVTSDRQIMTGRSCMFDLRSMFYLILIFIIQKKKRQNGFWGLAVFITNVMAFNHVHSNRNAWSWGNITTTFETMITVNV